VEGISKSESEVPEKSETIGVQYDHAPLHMANYDPDSTLYILHSSPKVSCRHDLLSLIHIQIERKCCFPWPAPLSGLLPILSQSIPNSNKSPVQNFFRN
jgi:hypothetical protein